MQIYSFAQITFEEINSPIDFNLSNIKQSPNEEYFAMAYGDGENIYTSVDGQDWSMASLPNFTNLNDMQFYDDGTPLITAGNYDHLIRRNGIWYTMNFNGGGFDLEATINSAGNTINVTHLNPGVYNLVLKKDNVIIGLEKFIKVAF